MDVTVELSEQDLVQLRKATELDNNSDAVACAVREYVRICSLRELKDISGRVEYRDDTER
ncbi:hypothetical protein [Aeoliella sp.]|uniref:hypothetical protein n=1 Tax=Aeoliella sp. TaxID=2795800 RepID=UPI003CCC0A82